MKTARLWVARALVLAVCGALLLIWNPPHFGSSSGPVWGRVRLNGRPLTTGAVVFVPVGDSDCQAASGRIDRDGSYTVKTQWSRPDNRPAHYKICIIPVRHRGTTRGTERGERLSPHVVPVSFSPETQSAQNEDFAVPRRFRSLHTTDLEVDLGQESARIDIDLKD
jgi:hypothetical protein